MLKHSRKRLRYGNTCFVGCYIMNLYENLSRGVVAGWVGGYISLSLSLSRSFFASICFVGFLGELCYNPNRTKKGHETFYTVIPQPFYSCSTLCFGPPNTAEVWSKFQGATSRNFDLHRCGKQLEF